LDLLNVPLVVWLTLPMTEDPVTLETKVDKPVGDVFATLESCSDETAEATLWVMESVNRGV
jgi:hypothetical protein